MGALLPRQPTLTFIGKAGCPVCAEVHAKVVPVIRQALEPRGVRVRELDLARDNVPFAVPIFPAMHLELADGTAFHLDAKAFEERFGRLIARPGDVAWWVRRVHEAHRARRP